MATPKGFEERRLELESCVIRRCKSHIDLSDPDYRFVGPAENQRERERVLKFARALQIEYLHFHNWNGTPRPDNAITKKSRTSPTHRPSK